MTSLEALILGIIQGITEFLPVSSSGHLMLGRILLGFNSSSHYLAFDLVCHLGTLFAIFLFFFKPITLILRYDKQRILQVAVATLPLFPLVLIIKNLEMLFTQPKLLGFSFLITAFLLYLGIKFGKSDSTARSSRDSWKDPLAIGLFQALALVPGISRSGSTISAARILGWSYSDAILFSFLLAIPAILGSITLELYRLLTHQIEQTHASINLLQYMLGFLASWIFGSLALSLLIRLATKNKFMYFVWYCVIIGLFTLAYTHLRT